MSFETSKIFTNSKNFTLLSLINTVVRWIVTKLLVFDVENFCFCKWFFYNDYFILINCILGEQSSINTFGFLDFNIFVEVIFGKFLFFDSLRIFLEPFECFIGNQLKFGHTIYIILFLKEFKYRCTLFIFK